MRLHTVGKGTSALLLGLTAAAAIARAAPGFVTQGMNLRAGPSIDYPLVAQLPQGTPTEIFGCLAGWSWCDVATEGVRGWVAGAGLQLLYDGRPEPLYGYGAAVGLPFIGFDVDRYWGRYYRGRPWFNDAGRWRGQGPHGGPPGGFADHDRPPGAPIAAPFHGEPGLGHPVGPATFQGHGPERGPEPAGPAMRAGPEPARASPPAPHPEPRPQAAPAAGHPAPGRPAEGHGGHDEPPH